MRVFKNHNLDIEVIDEIVIESKRDNIYDMLSKIDVDNITPVDALLKLRELKELINR